jgi:hypothetical protein
VLEVRYGAGQEQFDLAAQYGFDQAVRERVIGLLIQPQQKLPLDACQVDSTS